ncbi:unnamed protein product [Rhodiola kirilowii]
MSVVGFDFGNETCVVTVARQRGIDVVLKDGSRRETPAVVCLGEKQRFIGTAGAASTMTNPINGISQIKRLSGRQFSDPELQKDLVGFPFCVTEDQDGYPLINVQYLCETRSFTPTQLLGMVLSNWKGIAEKNLGAAVVDCCIGIPVYFSDLHPVDDQAVWVFTMNKSEDLHEEKWFKSPSCALSSKLKFCISDACDSVYQTSCSFSEQLLVIVVSYKGGTKKFSDTRNSFIVLFHQYKFGDAYLGTTIEIVDVTFATYFNDSQLQAINDASIIAGLNILRIITEPIHIISAYDLAHKATSVWEKMVLIFDPGGMTLDVHILMIKWSVFEVTTAAELEIYLGDVLINEWKSTSFAKWRLVMILVMGLVMIFGEEQVNQVQFDGASSVRCPGVATTEFGADFYINRLHIGAFLVEVLKYELKTTYGEGAKQFLLDTHVYCWLHKSDDDDLYLINFEVGTIQYESHMIPWQQSIKYHREIQALLMMLLFETILLNSYLNLDDHVSLVRNINKFIMFSLPRPPEVGDLEDKVDFKGKECYVLNYVIIRSLGT